MFKKRNLMEELTDYIKNNLKKGYTKESLRWALTNQGYSRLEIQKAFQKVDMDLADSAPILRTKPEIKYEIVEDNPQDKRKGFFGLFRK